MNPEVLTGIEIIISVIIAIAAMFISYYFIIKAKNMKIALNSEKFNQLYNILREIVTICVDSTNQTLVNDLKEEGEFDNIEQHEAFQQTLSNVLKIVGEVVPNDLIPDGNTLSIDTIVRELIETIVAERKPIICDCPDYENILKDCEETEENETEIAVND